MKAKGKQLRRSKLLSGWLPIMTGTTILNICSVTGQTHTVTAVQMDHSRNVVQDDDHMVIWGLGGRYAWLSYPTNEIPFELFSIEIEAAAEPADGRWPEIAVAVNDSAGILVKKTIVSTEWHQISMGEFTRKATDRSLFFSFTNDYRNRQTGADLNLKLRSVTFRQLSIETFTLDDSIKIRWNQNREPDLAGHRVHYGFQTRSYSRAVDVKKATHFQPILEPESIYYFAVSAYDTAGNSSGYSDEVRFYLTSINPLGVNPHFSPLPRLLFFGKEIALGNRGS
jgi:hypothetical protein